MRFKEGEKVSFLNETGSAKIVRIISEHEVVIEDEDGFESNYPTMQLVKIQSENYETGGYFEKGEELIDSRIKHTVHDEVKTGRVKDAFWEIDLHIHEITDSNAGMSNADMLRRQLIEFKSFYKKALRNNVKKIVAIHGVGIGALKEEIRTYLDTQEGIEYYDSDFREYGKGATTVEFFHTKID